MSQLERIYYIDQQIRTNDGVTAKSVAEHFEVSDRTIKRDIEYLRDRLGAPIEWNPEQNRYEYSSPWDRLAFADIRSLMTMAFIQAILEKQPYIPIVSDELSQRLKKIFAGPFETISDRVRYELPDMEALQEQHAFDLCQAMLEKQWVDVRYRDSGGKESDRRIAPLRLINYGGKWYCVAYDEGRQALRTFALKRFLQLSLSQDAVSGLPEEETIEQFLRDSYGIFKGKPIGKAVLRFYGGAARAVQEQVWHPQQELRTLTAEELPDPSVPQPVIDLTLPARDWTELLGRALRCGRYCEVLSPPEFRQLWQDEIAALAKLAELAAQPGPT